MSLLRLFILVLYISSLDGFNWHVRVGSATPGHVDTPETGSCFPNPISQNWVKVNSNLFQDANACNACLEVKNQITFKKIIVSIIDSCFDCQDSDLKLSNQAYNQLSGFDTSLNPVEITWRPIFCPNLKKPITWEKDQDIQGNTVLRFQHHSIAITSLHYKDVNDKLLLALRNATTNQFILSNHYPDTKFILGHHSQQLEYVLPPVPLQGTAIYYHQFYPSIALRKKASVE